MRGDGDGGDDDDDDDGNNTDEKLETHRAETGKGIEIHIEIHRKRSSSITRIIMAALSSYIFPTIIDDLRTGTLTSVEKREERGGNASLDTTHSSHTCSAPTHKSGRTTHKISLSSREKNNYL